MVFVKNRDVAKTPDYTVAGYKGCKEKKGVVGVEIEVESGRPNSFFKSNFGKWHYKPDGSLRGADNAEYMFAAPLSWEDADAAIDELWAKFRETNAQLADSNRTSVHVHLNVLPFYQNRLVNLFCLWFIFEEVLSLYSGEFRAGNLFCIRAKDGPAIINRVKEYIETKGVYGPPDHEGMHYSALNVGAISKFGSVEVRTMRGLTDPQAVKTWVSILRKLYDLSEHYQDPRSIIEAFSMNGPMDFFRLVFREHAEEIYAACGLDSGAFTSSLYEGCRYAQDLAYARDWSDFNPAKAAVDPFGRKTTKKSSSLTELAMQVAEAAPRPHRIRMAPQWNTAAVEMNNMVFTQGGAIIDNG